MTHIALLITALLVAVAKHSPLAFQIPPGFVTHQPHNGVKTSPSCPSLSNAKRQEVSRLHASGESEVEALLRKARELRAQAEAEEKTFHEDLIEKKAKGDAETDALIDKLFSGTSLVKSIRENRPSTDCLLKVIERLYRREVSAKGFRHVEASKKGQSDVSVQFEVVALPDENEVERLAGMIDDLIQAATVLDDEFNKGAQSKGGGTRAHHTEGELAHHLRDRINCLRREHDDQFQKRQGEFYEAARRKKGRKDVEDVGAGL